MISNELTRNKAFPSNRIQGKLTLGTKKNKNLTCNHKMVTKFYQHDKLLRISAKTINQHLLIT